MKGRRPTHIPGMDELINGGFPDGTINLLTGPPGSAKSLFGMHYIYNGARYEDEPGIYLTLEESRSSILRAATSYGLDIESFEKEGKSYLIDLGKMRVECSSAEELEWGLASFETLQDFLKNHISFSGAKRLVLDSLTAVGVYYKSNELLRRELFKFTRFLKDADITTLLISEVTGDGDSRYGIEEFVADSLIKMDYESTSGEYRRTLTVKKMRFTKHDPLKHPFLIMDNGIEVSPDEVIG
ncbi:MAG: ATPase domain-containing protein [Candidatus Thermoplasmatota archaeon]|nr:ATPase domain-containing protein [Candidatus Thermoplasmatota archaeon]